MKINMTKQAIEIWRTLRNACRHMNCVAVTVTFDGEGDSGQIEDIVYLSATGVMETPHLNLGECEVESGSAYHDGEWTITTEKKEMTLDEAIETLTYDVLSETYGGWEIDSGSFGEVRFNTLNGEIACHFNERVITASYNVDTFRLDDAPKEA